MHRSNGFQGIVRVETLQDGLDFVTYTGEVMATRNRK